MRKKSIGYAALLSVVAAVASGCAGVNEKDKVIQGLNDRINQLQKSVDQTNARLEDLGAKVSIIADKADAAGKAVERLSSVPSAPPQGLTIVKLGEEDAKKADAPAPVVLTNGAEPAKAALATQRPEPVKSQGASPVPGTREQADKPERPASMQKADKPIAAEARGKAVNASADTSAGSGLDAQSLYDKGQELYSGGRLEDARSIFTSFVKSYPEHNLADNALYWIGESYYSEKDFDTAAAKFSEVFNIYPASNKAPDALLKAGYSYMELNRLEKAQEALGYVVKRYQGTEAASMATKALKGLSSAKKEGAR